MKRYRGFSLLELLIVIGALSVIAYGIAQFVSDGQEQDSFNEAVVNDANQLKIIASAVDLYTEANVDSYANDTTVEIDLTSNAFKQYLPSVDYSAHVLSSGVGVRAYVRKEETTPGSGVYVPKSVIKLD